ncbi:putative ABC transporter ATP-binding protein YejF [Achromobacter insuavis]|uniref:dipeptide ABC transporter ATP-binding protein n=1 Tax=Achromobacter insuavis TaxID=1287735 RepID=UPI00146921AD|nr:ABC transporter ATP-binding protein [Achromobacter insuavis]CAB3893037.1 putative ABC transporter ATP-binding protein YejF [Achromobacter insuavis]
MTTSSSPALLHVEQLCVSYGATQVVHDASFTLRPGHSLALIGESGSGKSTIAKALLGLLPDPPARVSGRLLFQGQDLSTLTGQAWRRVRGRDIGFVPQDPQNALNPVRTIGSQAHEAAALVEPGDAARQRRLILDVLARVGLPDPERVYQSFPHELSGGMLQRVLIGLAVLPQPKLIIADEPTSALDVTIQKRILDLLGELRAALDIGLLLITHDLAIAAQRCEEVVVLQHGRIQEQGRSADLFARPRSTYTRKLLLDVPALNPGRYPRAPRAAGGVAPIEVRGASKRFDVAGKTVAAVQDVSFSVAAGSTHALVGESGSGKTTLVRMLLGLETLDDGEIRIDGERLQGRSRRDLWTLRRHLQLVYQNPYTSLDPTWKVHRIIQEPLDHYAPRGDNRRLVADAARAVGLDPELLERRPAALSGGQRQRVAIARALVLRPRILVLDEPTSALDVSVQAGILDVLFALQQRLGLTYLFVSHDLSLVRQVADTVTVLQHGRLIEHGPTQALFDNPRHPYTRSLIDAIPQAPARPPDAALH